MTMETGEPTTNAERRVQEAVRNLPRPAATPAFRARLKHDFATGRIGAPRTIELQGPRLSLRWLALAPALLVLAIALVLANRAPAWRVASTSGEGIVVVGGRPIPAGHLAEMSQRMTPGTTIEPAGTVVHLESPGNLVLEVLPGSRLILPNAPGRWFSRQSQGRLERGEVRITTFERFHGARLAIGTPELNALVTGTTLAVIRAPNGTCVCVLEGTVRVGELGGEMEAVTSGRRKMVHNDGSPIEHDAMLPVERIELARFRDQAHE
jgi:hypothetical protein